MPGLHLLDPVLASYMDEFQRVTGLLDTRGLHEPELARLTRRLCELSREIRVKLGPPKDAAEDLVQRIVRLLRDGATAIEAIQGLVGDKDVEAYRSNVAARADNIERGE